MNYQEFISINSNIRFGKPCIKGTRITVYDVLGWLTKGMYFEDILLDSSEFSIGQIKACLSYAANKERRVKILST